MTKPLQLDSLMSAWCRMQAELFMLAWKSNYVMAEFFKAYMNSKMAARFDSVYDEVQWMSVERILERTVRECHLVPRCKRDDVNEEAVLWAGYFYRFWHLATGESSKAIYRQCPWEYVKIIYAGYHTVACEKAIDWIKSAKGRRQKAA